MAAQEETKPNLEEQIEWNVETEIRLFEAMLGHRPVGINKHFHMAGICSKFESLVGKSVSSDAIWKHLDTMYDLAALDKKESMPFPNEEEEFCLPEAEYSELINQKLSSSCKSEPVSEVQVKDEKATPKGGKESVQPKEVSSKKEKKGETEEPLAAVVKKEPEEAENEGKKGKTRKEEKPTVKRGKRTFKDKKNEDESSPVVSSTTKKSDDDLTSTQASHKKEKQNIGKRTLRSRTDEGSSKASTPPLAKRARRI